MPVSCGGSKGRGVRMWEKGWAWMWPVIGRDAFWGWLRERRGTRSARCCSTQHRKLGLPASPLAQSWTGRTWGVVLWVGCPEVLCVCPLIGCASSSLPPFLPSPHDDTDRYNSASSNHGQPASIPALSGQGRRRHGYVLPPALLLLPSHSNVPSLPPPPPPKKVAAQALGPASPSVSTRKGPRSGWWT